jgi:predicted glycoside hydrolase/deacetylase ChbG (UPF0249 family)
MIDLKNMLNNETRKKAIFSADDFGISKLANANILKAIRMGKIDRVEVMISENLNEEEVRELKDSQVKIDIHLHLVDYHSNYWRGDRRLSEGAIKRVIIFFLRYLCGKTVPEKVELQWAIQIEKFEEIFGKAPDGIGSHEYIHFFPPYLRAVIRLSKKYDISFIRFGKTDFEYNNFISKALNLLRKKSLKNIKQTTLSTTDYMTSFDWGNKLDFLNNLPTGSLTEIVFHPEREDELKYLEKL